MMLDDPEGIRRELVVTGGGMHHRRRGCGLSRLQSVLGSDLHMTSGMAQCTHYLAGSRRDPSKITDQLRRAHIMMRKYDFIDVASSQA